MSFMNYNNFNASNLLPIRDPRTIGWTLVGNVPFLMTLLSGYVYLVKCAGPRFMKNREPYERIKPVIQLYNASMVLLNIYFVKNFFTRSYFGGGYDIVCQGIDFQKNDRVSHEFLELCWWYFWVRVADFLDTIFFVLRKKDSHVSFLHVAHHVLVVFNGWYGLTFGPDGQAASALIFNGSVHVVMYSYYFFSLLGPAVRPYLWWKRYLTLFQMVQFVVIMIHNIIPLIRDCSYPRGHTIIGLPQGVFFIAMFIRFYAKAYRGKQISARESGRRHKVQ
ncbi:unnamed protein product [Ixodes persulcatus]